MELEYDTWGHRDAIVALVDCVKHVAVSSYLAFVAVPRFDLPTH